MPTAAAAGGHGRSPDEVAEDTEVDVEVEEEGEEVETAGPAPSGSKEHANLSPATYRIGQSRVTEEDLDDYVGRGLMKAYHRSLCHASEREEVPKPEPYEAVVFRDFF